MRVRWLGLGLGLGIGIGLLRVVKPKPKPNPSPKLSPHPTPSPKPGPNLEQRAPRLGPGLHTPREDGARHRGDVAPPGKGGGVITGELAATLA